MQEVKPSDVPADRSWCNGCGQLFKPDKDKAVYQCPQCDQVINSTISQVMKNKELWLCGFFCLQIRNYRSEVIIKDIVDSNFGFPLIIIKY